MITLGTILYWLLWIAGSLAAITLFIVVALLLMVWPIYAIFHSLDGPEQ